MSPVLGLFLLGMIFPMVTTEGAITGLVSSLVVMSWLLVGKYAHNFPPQEMALKCVSNCNITVFPNKSRNHLLHPDHREIEFDDPHSTFNLSYLWFSPLAILIVVAMGVTFSYLRGFQDPKSVDPRLIVPLVDVAFPFDCLSEKTRKLLRFGVDHEGKYDDMKPKQRMPSEESAPPHSILETRKNFSEPLNITEIEILIFSFCTAFDKDKEKLLQ
ncbi:hypothetical protein RRG08_030595 [Elysia crispata]|uniref:Uncharacterized protein n=1 Tax=Elysia crispata TaxID=231223 RepID=A0AAE0Y4H0_9GAST|nr:hypothetical protein RRG08_030595 [Elysia crispata]